MKNKSSNQRLSYFFRQRIPGKDSSDNRLELVKRESEWEAAESVREDILRWADDGGQMLDPGSPIAGSNPDMARGLANE
jgi:hypothetical protein